MKLIIHFIVSVLAILIASYLVPGTAVSLVSAIVLVVVLGILNVFVKPIIKIITLPINILTLGLFSLVVNALFIILASRLVPGFVVTGFWTAFIFSIVLSIINTFFGLFENKNN